MVEMDKSSRKPVNPVHTVSRRSFFKAAGAGLALLAATSYGLSFPKIANAQDQYVQIEGQNVKVNKLDKPLAEFDAATQQYRRPETTDPRNGMYQIDVIVPGEVCFLVTLNDLSDGGIHKDFMNITFPKERENPNVPESRKGLRGADLKSFVELVKKTTGQDVKRVKIVLEQGTFDYEGNNAKYYNAYVFPIDAQGNKITSRSTGQYLVFEATHFYYPGGADAGADSNSHGKTLLLEPGAPGPVARR